MRAQATSDHHVFVRATTGQSLELCYDPLTNAIEFIEDSWAADLRAGVTSRSVHREQLDTARTSRRMKQRRLILVS